MTVRSALDAVRATPAEVGARLPSDDLVPRPDVVMDRAFTLDASPDQVWPWVVQLGKQRAGWYLPRRVERLVPPGRRAARRVEDRWQGLAPGDVIPDYGGPRESFTVAVVERPSWLVHVSTRGTSSLSWAIGLTALPGSASGAATRVHLRLRVGPVKHRRLVGTVGDLFDLLTIAGLAAGLAERVEPSPR